MNDRCLDGVGCPEHEGDDGLERVGGCPALQKTVPNLTALKTILEIQARHSTIDVHVIRIPVKAASNVLRWDTVPLILLSSG